jgi:hypothetical protein
MTQNGKLPFLSLFSCLSRRRGTALILVSTDASICSASRGRFIMCAHRVDVGDGTLRDDSDLDPS